MKQFFLIYILSFIFSFNSFASYGPYFDKQITAESEEKITVNIKMVGDDLIHQPVYSQCLMNDGTYNFDKLFSNIKEDIESADIAIINQETILVHNKNQVSSYPMFGTPEEIGHSIVSAGFDVVAHATNHTMDKGINGIQNTLNFWNTNYPEITVLGIHNKGDFDVSFIEKNGIKFGFVNYTYGLNGLESRRKGNEYIVDLLSDSDIETTLNYAKDNCDVLISILHIGNEYVYEPTTYQKEQIEKFIDLGSDIVLCAHPHVLQPYEMVTTENGNNGLVYYSLGNFVSSQNEIPRVLGGMADITITKESDNIYISNYSLIPLVTHQEPGNYTTYRLDEYSDELAAKHRLTNKGFSKENLYTLFNQITK